MSYLSDTSFQKSDMNFKGIPNFSEYGKRAIGDITDYFSIKTIESIMTAHPVHKPHCHALLFQITWITEGQYYLTVDEMQYQLQKDHLLLLQPNTIHATNFSDSLKGYVIHFSIDFYHALKIMNPLFSRIINKDISHRLISIQTIPKESEEIEELFKRMKSISEGNSLLKNDILRSYVNIILLKIYEHYSLKRKNKLYNASQTLMNRFYHALDQHYIDKKAVSDYAEILNISPGYLNALSKKEANKTAGKIIQEKIITEAKRLLIYSEKDITEISYALNFSDTSYFWRMFKKHTEYTPKQFREKYK